MEIIFAGKILSVSQKLRKRIYHFVSNRVNDTESILSGLSESNKGITLRLHAENCTKKLQTYVFDNLAHSRWRFALLSHLMREIIKVKACAPGPRFQGSQVQRVSSWDFQDVDELKCRSGRCCKIIRFSVSVKLKLVLVGNRAEPDQPSLRR